MRSGPGAARTILLSHIISARPSKQPLMVRTFLKVYMELGSYFLFLQEEKTSSSVDGGVTFTESAAVPMSLPPRPIWRCGTPRRVSDSVGDVLGVRCGEQTGSKESRPDWS